jgi:general secretion pathway protein G
MQRKHRGFTLVEILIVVMILGIIAAIVIPQVSTASQDTRLASIQTTLAKVRNQLELFKIEHNSTPVQTTGMWAAMLTRSDTTETNVANPAGTKFGPYLQAAPINNWNNFTTVSSVAVDSNAGWYFTCDTQTYELRARNTDGTINFNY